jgi:putative membrane protein
MKDFLKRPAYEAKKFIIIYYLIGLIGLTIPFTARYFIYIIPFSILINIFFVFYYNNDWDAGFIICSILIIVLGTIAEMAGVNTGMIFGSYSYSGSVLGPRLFGTPLIIGLNWYILIYCTFVLVNKFRTAVIVKILTGGVIMVIFDILLEPVAGSLNMWKWAGGEVPLQNYAAWFVLACLFLVIMYLGKANVKNVISIHLLIVQFIFFAGLNLFL